MGDRFAKWFTKAGLKAAAKVVLRLLLALLVTGGALYGVYHGVRFVRSLFPGQTSEATIQANRDTIELLRATEAASDAFQARQDAVIAVLRAKVVEDSLDDRRMAAAIGTLTDSLAVLEDRPPIRGPGTTLRDTARFYRETAKRCGEEKGICAAVKDSLTQLAARRLGTIGTIGLERDGWRVKFDSMETREKRWMVAGVNLSDAVGKCRNGGLLGVGHHIGICSPNATTMAIVGAIVGTVSYALLTGGDDEARETVRVDSVIVRKCFDRDRRAHPCGDVFPDARRDRRPSITFRLRF